MRCSLPDRSAGWARAPAPRASRSRAQQPAAPGAAPSWPGPEPVLPFLAAGAAFLVHNLVDFTAFLPGVAIPAAILIGLGFGPGDAAAPPERPTHAAARPRGGVAVLHALPAAAGLALFLGHALLSSRA